MDYPRNTSHYIIPGTKFLRLASKAWMGTWGTNLQNIEKGMRKLYWADTGYRLNQVDQSGAEALIVAYLCREGNFRKLFLNNVKPHVFVGLHLFKDKWKEKIKYEGLDIHCDFDELCNTAIEDLKANPWWKQVDALIKSSDNWPPSERYYYIAKQVCHSSNYGIKAGMFCLNTLDKSRGKVVLKKKDAEFFLDMYHGLFPEIREWHRETEQIVRASRILYTLQGYPIQFTGALETESHIKEVLSAVPQGTVAMVTREAFVKMQSFIQDTGADYDMLGDCHDSYLTQCRDDDSEVNQCQSLMKRFIEPELTSPRGEKFNMKSEGASGYNWAPYDEKKNPQGLKEYKIQNN
jgi:hypothetical protein